MGMNRIDKGMNRARTVGGALRHSAAGRLAAPSNRTNLRPRRLEGRRPLKPLSHSAAVPLSTSLSLPFSHYRPILHSSLFGGGTGRGRREWGRDDAGPAVTGCAPQSSKWSVLIFCAAVAVLLVFFAKDTLIRAMAGISVRGLRQHGLSVERPYFI